MIDKLHYISQQTEHGSHTKSITRALHAGCKWIQLRVKGQTPEAVLAMAIEAKQLCDQHGAKLIINDFPEIAAKVGAYGLHLGLLDMPISHARKIVGKQMVIGGTANTLDQVQQRITEGANYIGLGPLRFTPTKQNLSPILGLTGISAILEQIKTCPIPIIAIGGILPDDIATLMAFGAHGVAMSGAITFAEQQSAFIAQLYQSLNALPLNVSELKQKIC